MVTIQLTQGILMAGAIGLTIAIALILLVIEYASNRKTRKAVDKLAQTELTDPFNKKFLLERVLNVRGGRGKNGIQPLKWVLVQNMSNSWLANCIIYNEERGYGKEEATELYRTELAFREKYNITIEDDEDLQYQTALENTMIWIKADKNSRGRSGAARKIEEEWEKIIGEQRAKLLMEDEEEIDLDLDD